MARNGEGGALGGGRSTPPPPWGRGKQLYEALDVVRKLRGRPAGRREPATWPSLLPTGGRRLWREGRTIQITGCQGEAGGRGRGLSPLLPRHRNRNPIFLPTAALSGRRAVFRKAAKRKLALSPRVQSPAEARLLLTAGELLRPATRPGRSSLCKGCHLTRSPASSQPVTHPLQASRPWREPAGTGARASGDRSAGQERGWLRVRRDLGRQKKARTRRAGS